MRRSVTNKIRFILDELIPPIVRDSRWFMGIVCLIYFKGKIPPRFMDFKALSVNMSDQEIKEYYTLIGSYENDRAGDLSTQTEEYIFKKIGKKKYTLLDVGCGKGHFLKMAKKFEYVVEGCDFVKTLVGLDNKFTQCSAERLTFSEKSFDIVTCFHTLEHVRNIQVAIEEIKRVARKKIVIVVPCQRYYRYTVDLHLHFFPSADSLIKLMGLRQYSCTNIGGDLVYVGRIN